MSPCARALLVAGFCLLGAAAMAEDRPEPIQVIIKDHRFAPAEVHLPPGKPAVLDVRNEDDTPEEVESASLQIEKVIPAGAFSRIRLKALPAGRYPFAGEFHPETAQGVIVAE